MIVFAVASSLSLALVVPRQEISLLSGTMQAFSDMLDKLGLGELVRPVAILLVLGGVAHMIPWILGPAKGLAAVARHGYLPPALGRMSRNRVPVQGLVVQAIGGTVFCLLFLFLPNANATYGILTAVTAQVIVIMYALIFAAVLRLRYTQPETDRTYRIPGGRPGVWLAAGGGIAACAFAFVTGFFPPSDFVSWDTGQRVTYYAVLVAGFLVLTAPRSWSGSCAERAGRGWPSRRSSRSSYSPSWPWLRCSASSRCSSRSPSWCSCSCTPGATRASAASASRRSRTAASTSSNGT